MNEVDAESMRLSVVRSAGTVTSDLTALPNCTFEIQVIKYKMSLYFSITRINYAVHDNTSEEAYLTKIPADFLEVDKAKLKEDQLKLFSDAVKKIKEDKTFWTCPICGICRTREDWKEMYMAISFCELHKEECKRFCAPDIFLMRDLYDGAVKACKVIELDSGFFSHFKKKRGKVQKTAV